MTALLQDIRYALRQLRQNPGFAGVAVLTLALGIGANTAIFTVINGVLLRPLPYREPDRLVTVEHHYPGLNNLLAPVSVPGFLAYQQQTQIFERAAVQSGWGPSLTGRGDAQQIIGSQVTGDWFTTLGVNPEAGRALRPEEAEVGHDKVVVLSHGFWQRIMGGDKAALGQQLILDGESYEIVGVMPAGFRDFWNRRAELWVPLAFLPAQKDPNRWTNESLPFTGRLKPGVSFEQAKADMAAFGVRLRTDNPDRFSPDWGLAVSTINEKATGSIRLALYVLLGAVGFVLLIACANVANLQLARAAARSREMAVRVALGASPGALVRQLLTESTILALIGGALGVLLALWGVPALLTLNPGNLPPAAELGVDGTVLGYSLGISLLTGLLFGMAPALRLMRTNLQDSLREGGKGATADRGGLALRRALVVATLALALMLLTGAGLLVRSFGRLLGVDPGFQPTHLLTFNVALPNAHYPNDTTQIALFDRLLPAVAAVPGVVSVGSTSVLPFGGSWSTGSFNVEGYQSPPNTPSPWGDIRIVTPGFLSTIQAPLKHGRQFTEQDNAAAPQVVIVDEELVSRYWPNQDPIGKRITFNNLTDSTIQWVTVVGVVGHTMHEGLDGQRRVQLYFPLKQIGLAFQGFAVRTTGDPTAVLPAVKAAIRGVDPDIPVANVSTMEELINGTTGPRRFAMYLLGGFSLLAATLASVGLYGVMSFLVTQRSRELGVRMALGAATRDVLGLVLGQGMRLAIVGVLIGLMAALAVTRFIRSMLFNVATTDPVTFVLIPLLLLAVAFLAIYLPARRATRLDPMIALRAE